MATRLDEDAYAVKYAIPIHLLDVGLALKSGSVQATVDGCRKWFGAPAGPEFESSDSIAAGAEWPADEGWSIRAGAKYARHSERAERFWLVSAQPGSEIGASAGVGYAFESGATFDAGVMWMHSLTPSTASYDSVQLAVSAGFVRE